MLTTACTATSMAAPRCPQPSDLESGARLRCSACMGPVLPRSRLWRPPCSSALTSTATASSPSTGLLSHSSSEPLPGGPPPASAPGCLSWSPSPPLPWLFSGKGGSMLTTEHVHQSPLGAVIRPATWEWAERILLQVRCSFDIK